MEQTVVAKEINFVGFSDEKYKDVLTTEAKTFLVALHTKFNQRRLELLKEREVAQQFFDAGNLPSFPS